MVVFLFAVEVLPFQTFKEPLEALAHDPESGLLSKAEIMQIFSRVPSLVEVHEKICNELRTYVMHWSTDRLIGKVSFDHYRLVVAKGSNRRRCFYPSCFVK